MKKDDRICPVEKAGHLDHRVRRWLQNPEKILQPYVKPGMAVLDAGCGPGFFSVAMARMSGPSGHVTAVDLQAGMLEKVRQKVRGSDLEERITLHQCKPDRLGLEGQFDFILAFYVVHELPDQRLFFTEAAGLLKPGGRLLVVEPLFHASKKAFSRTLSIARAAGLMAEASPKYFFSRAAVLQISKNGGDLSCC